MASDNRQGTPVPRSQAAQNAPTGPPGHPSRSATTDINASVTTAPIQPWKDVRKCIQINLNIRATPTAHASSASHLIPATVDAVLSRPYSPPESLPPDIQPGIPDTESDMATLPEDNSSNRIKTALPITIPHGFHSLFTLPHNRPIRSVAYIPPSTAPEQIVTLDARGASVWRGSQRFRRIACTGAEGDRGREPHGGVFGKKGRDVGKSGLTGIVKWVWVDSLRCWIVATTQLQIKVMNAAFGEMAVVSVAKPTLA